MITKDTLRRQALDLRRALSAADRTAFSRQILTQASQLLRHLPPNPGVLSGFWPIHHEPDVRLLLDYFRTQGWQIALPCIESDASPLAFRLWPTPDTPLRMGPRGIQEPFPDSKTVDPDVMLIPCAAFDHAGHRLGYGGGYFDRTLEKQRATRHVIAIGIAFSLQEVELIPAEPHDELLDFTLTEKGVQLHAR